MKSKTVLILGASGTLGQALIESFLKTDIGTIRCYSRNEHKQFLLRQRFGDPNGRMRYFIGDIRDKERLSRAYIGVDIVINCAALKHIDFCQEFPYECIMTNVIGSQYAVECAIDHNVSSFVQISTDKVVFPTTTYGKSKSLAEDIVLNAQNWRGKCETKFIVLRSGNILDSNGSVLEVWRAQRSIGVPLTITHLDATRYMVEPKVIADTVMNLATGEQEGLFVLNPKKYTVQELLSANGFADCELNIVGLREGEKIDEVLYREDEKFTLIDV